MAATAPSFATPPASGPDSDRIVAHDRITLIALATIAVMAFGLGIILLAMRWDTPLLGMHSFRQTQTAITSYWILKGSPWFAYQTPVLGAPWSIPFEFPIYQLLVAAIVKVTGLPLDPAGRVISYLFLVLTILPVRSIARAYGLGDHAVLVFAILLLTSPIYLFWGTTFLIETMAVFFGVAFLAAIQRSTHDSTTGVTASAAVLGIIGALIKVTTFAPFFMLAGVILLCHLAERARRHLPLGRSIVSAVASMLPAPLVFLIWDRFADAQKAQSPLGRPLMSSTALMHQWNFGTWDQLFSKDLPITLLRATTDTVGVLAIVVFVSLIVFGGYYRIFEKRLNILLAAAFAGFLCPYFLFTNLHIRHNYYDAADAVFLIFAIAIVIGTFFSRGHSLAGWTVLTLAVVSQLLWFHTFFAKDLDHRGDSQLALAEAIRANTSDDAVIVVYGRDWSAVIPYYSQRRAIMEPPQARDAILNRARNLFAPEGGYPVQAVVHCMRPMDPELAKTLKQQIAAAHMQPLAFGDCELYLSPSPANTSGAN